MANQQFDVFLCHNSEDKPAVIEIAQQLQNNNLKPWLDVWELQPGAIWQYALEQQIANIDTVAVFVGKRGLGPWQEQEIYAFLQEFIRRNRPVIPVLLPDATLTPQLPIFLRSRHWVDFRTKEPDPLLQLTWGVTGHKPTRKFYIPRQEQSTIASIEPFLEQSSSRKTPKTTQKLEKVFQKILFIISGVLSMGFLIFINTFKVELSTSNSLFGGRYSSFTEFRKIGLQNFENEILLPADTMGSLTGKISGNLIYPSTFLPPQKVCAEEAFSGDDRYCVETVLGASNFSIELPRGVYYVYAMPCSKIEEATCRSGNYDENTKAYYNRYVECAEINYAPDCVDTSPIPITVDSGAHVQDVKPHDWYSFRG